jgi:hypothetical protein
MYALPGEAPEARGTTTASPAGLLRTANTQTIRFWQQGHQEMAAGKVGLPGRPARSACPEPITPPVPLPPA